MASGVGAAWRGLTSEQRLAAVAAIALLLSMLLPWYRETGTVIVRGKAQGYESSLSAFEVYSFVEAAIFVVSAGVLGLLYARGHGKAFHLPGGDGSVLMAAGVWVMLLVFYRQFDRPDQHDARIISGNVSVNWGIFIAFLLGAVLAYAGYRIRAAHTPEPVGDVPPQTPPPPPDEQRTTVAEPPPARPDGADEPYEGQLSFDEPAEYRPPPRRG